MVIVAGVLNVEPTRREDFLRPGSQVFRQPGAKRGLSTTYSHPTLTIRARCGFSSAGRPLTISQRTSP